MAIPFGLRCTYDMMTVNGVQICNAINFARSFDLIKRKTEKNNPLNEITTAYSSHSNHSTGELCTVIHLSPAFV